MGLREAPAQTACLVPLAFALGLTLLGRKEHLAELRWAGGQCWAPNTGSQGWLEEREVNPSAPSPPRLPVPKASGAGPRSWAPWAVLSQCK